MAKYYYRLKKHPPMLASIGAGMGWGIMLGLHLAHRYEAMAVGKADYAGGAIAFAFIAIWFLFMIRNSERVPVRPAKPILNALEPTRKFPI